MTASPSTLNKVKLLLALSHSPNPHEAESAKTLAQNLIDKHGITPEEIEALDPKPLYGEDEKIFASLGIVGWMQQLALCIGTHFECQIVQVELASNNEVHAFEYYAYGEPETVEAVKNGFNLLVGKVNNLLSLKIGRGDIYRTSYAEGVVYSIKNNISFFNFETPNISRSISKIVTENKLDDDISLSIEKSAERPRPAERHVDVNSQSNIQDIGAFFSGVYDGDDLIVPELLK